MHNRESSIELIEGDITALDDVDAIVNAANTHLQHGAGVAGAIVARGGSVIQEESNRIAPVPVGGAAVTSAGALPCRYVIHAVGPRMGEGDEEAKLRSATLSALTRAEELGIRSVAFPAISAGIFGFPIERCARIMLSATSEFMEKAEKVDRVVFCLFGTEAFDVFRKAFEELRDAGR